MIEYLKTNGHNIADTARVFRVNRTVVYDILAKSKEGNLKDRPKIPKHQPRQKIKSLRPRTKPTWDQKDYHGTLRNMKGFLSPQEQSGTF